MTQIVSSISGLPIYAPSAGFAPTDSAVVSAIASGYQVVSSTATQLYAGTAFLTEVNGATVSASRAGNAANASLANSAWYDGTGRLISALPDSAAVSAIASSYVVSGVSGKLDMTAQVVSATAGSGIFITSINGMGLSGQAAPAALPITGSVGVDSATYSETSVEFTRYETEGEPDIRTASLSPDALDITYTVDGNDYYNVHISENGIDFSNPDGYYSVNPYDIDMWNSAVSTVENNSASWAASGIDSATCSAIASSYAESAVSGKQDASAMTAYQPVSGMSAYQPSGDYAYDSALVDYQPVSGMTAYAYASSVPAISTVVLPDPDVPDDPVPETETCPICGGSGVEPGHEAGTPCGDCGGTGMIDNWLSCETCGGTGMIDDNVCPDCGGTGGTTETIPCATCGGTGIRQESMPCGLCGGTGVIEN